MLFMNVSAALRSFLHSKCSRAFWRLLSVLRQCEDCVNEASDKSLEDFFARGLKEYQCALRFVYTVESASRFPVKKINSLRIWNV